MYLPSIAAPISTPNSKRLQRTRNPTPPSARILKNHTETALVVLKKIRKRGIYKCYYNLM